MFAPRNRPASAKARLQKEDTMQAIDLSNSTRLRPSLTRSKAFRGAGSESMLQADKNTDDSPRPYSRPASAVKNSATRRKSLKGSVLDDDANEKNFVYVDDRSDTEEGSPIPATMHGQKPNSRRPSASAQNQDSNGRSVIQPSVVAPNASRPNSASSQHSPRGGSASASRTLQGGVSAASSNSTGRVSRPASEARQSVQDASTASSRARSKSPVRHRSNSRPWSRQGSVASDPVDPAFENQSPRPTGSSSSQVSSGAIPSHTSQPSPSTPPTKYDSFQQPVQDSHTPAALQDDDDEDFTLQNTLQASGPTTPKKRQMKLSKKGIDQYKSCLWDRTAGPISLLASETYICTCKGCAHFQRKTGGNRGSSSKIARTLLGCKQAGMAARQSCVWCALGSRTRRTRKQNKTQRICSRKQNKTQRICHHSAARKHTALRAHPLATLYTPPVEVF